MRDLKPTGKFYGHAEITDAWIELSNLKGRRIQFRPDHLIVLKNMYKEDAVFIKNQEDFDKLWDFLETML